MAQGSRHLEGALAALADLARGVHHGLVPPHCSPVVALAQAVRRFVVGVVGAERGDPRGLATHVGILDRVA